jgi:hypothetical protein
LNTKLLVAVIAIIIVVVATTAFMDLSGFPNSLQPQPTPTPSPSPTPTPTATPSPAPTTEPKTTWFDFVALDSSSGEIHGYLTKGGWNNGCIPNATVYLVDSVNGTVYSQTTTLTEMNWGKNLNVGGFSFTVPTSDVALSLQVVFRGDSEWKACTSASVSTCNPNVYALN